MACSRPNPATTMPACVVNGRSHATTAELSVCKRDTDHPAHQPGNIYYSIFYGKHLLAPTTEGPLIIVAAPGSKDISPVPLLTPTPQEPENHPLPAGVKTPGICYLIGSRSIGWSSNSRHYPLPSLPRLWQWQEILHLPAPERLIINLW